MIGYAMRRVLGMFPLLFLISIVIFSLAHLMPGDPFTGLRTEMKVSQDFIEKMRKETGVDDPIHTKYLRWMGNMAKGDLGHSVVQKLPVSEILEDRISNTIFLSLLSIIITYSLTIVLGMTAARKENSLRDRIIMSSTYFIYSIPTFFFAIIALFIFAVKLDWIPLGGTVSVEAAEDPIGYFMDRLHHTILPAVILGLMNTAAYTQFLRNDILDNMKKDYIRTAQAKGVSDNRIYYTHILKNSLIPLVTFLGLNIGTLLGGAVITETIFSYPGVGSLFIDSIKTRDYPVIMSVTLILSFMTLFGNMIADLLYGIVDPRIRLKS